MKFIIPVLAMVVIASAGCNDNSKEEKLVKGKLVKEWKLVDVGGKTGALLKDSARQAMMGNRYMEFREEGDMIATGGPMDIQRGDYKISDDGKTIITSRNGRASDTFLINKLTPDTLIIAIKRAGLELTWVPK